MSDILELRKIEQLFSMIFGSERIFNSVVWSGFGFGLHSVLIDG